MFIAIISHTPAWVWALFAGLVALGLTQTRDREISLTRLTALPLAMVGLSLLGAVSAFGHQPVALGAWAAGALVALVFARQVVAVKGACWSAASQRLHMPGSWLPLVLIVGLFLVKYGAGVSLALHPELATDPAFAGFCCLTYGAFSGLFLGRALPLRALARGPSAPVRA